GGLVARVSRVAAPSRSGGARGRGEHAGGREAGAPIQTADRVMTYLLDTNAVSALMKRAAPLVARLARVDRADVAVPQTVIAEIAFGIERLPRSKRRTELEAAFDLIREELPR